MPAEAAVRSAFAARFGRAPEGVWAAPGRVNLIGEHTDYNDGFVLPLAIDRRVTVAAARRPDDLLRILSLEKGTAEVPLVSMRPGAVEGWAAYVAGAVWSLAQEGVRVGGLDLVLTSDLPVGSGLSSSAAVECSTLLAARDLYGGPQELIQLARIAQRAENEMVGVPCGIKDQTASILRDATEAMLEASRDRLGELRYRRARHVVRENGRVLEVVRVLNLGRPDRIGPTLTASHASLRDDYQVSAAELDLAVEMATTAGALGARMTGAGFGGCALALVPAGAAETVAEAITWTFADRGLQPPTVFAVAPVDGAGRLP
jgi:galactokinase